MTDQDLYKGIAESGDDAFKYLYAQYFQRISTMILNNRGQLTDANDIFQEGVMILWMNIKNQKYKLTPEARISTYLFSVCRNLWLNKLRKTKKTKTVELTDEHDSEEPSNLSHEVPAEILQLEKNIKKLGANCQKLLDLFYFKKMSLKNISLEMDYTEKTAKNNKYRCMTRLRQLYEQERQIS